MALPSDPGYIPTTTDERILALPQYQRMLSMNFDPYAAHSREEAVQQCLEELIR